VQRRSLLAHLRRSENSISKPLKLKMAPRLAKKPAAANPTPKKEKAGGAKAKQTTPKTEPAPAVAVEVEEPKQSPAKPNGTEAVPDADIVMEDNVKQDAEEDSKDEKLDLDDNEPEHDVEGQEEQEDEVEGNQDGDVQEGDEEDGKGEGEEAEGQDGEGDEGDSQGEEAEGVEDEGNEGGDAEDEEHQINDIPAPLKDRRRQKEFEIFVGGLDKEADEEDLKKVFGVVGEIKEIRMSKNPVSQKNRGFAFIRYETIEAAKRALTELKDAQVKDKRCGVSPSQDNDTLYLGNICKTWTKDAVREKLKEYEIENIEEMALMDDPKNEGQNRGFAFLEFTTHQFAMNAYKRLQKRDVVFGCDRSAKVAFAESSVKPDEEVMAQIKNVFLDGLPASWDDARVKEELKKYGEIEKVQLSKNMPSAKRKDYGFVHFSTREEAQACVEGLSINELGEGDSKVKANIAKPQHKSRLVKQGVRGGYRLGEDKPEGGKGRKRLRNRRNDRNRNDRNRGRGQKTDKKKEKSSAPPEKQQADPKRATKNDSGRKKKGDRDTGSKKSNFKDQNRSRGLSRNDARRVSYPDDRYSRHLERVHSYLDAPSRPYSGVSGSKRPYSALDDVPRYADQALRHPRARLDYDVGAGAGASLYGGAAYGRLDRAPQAGYGGHGRTDLIGQQSFALYDSHQAGSLGGTAVGGLYSPGYGTSSLAGRSDIGGGSYSSLYESRRSGGGGGYLLGRGSRAYY